MGSYYCAISRATSAFPDKLGKRPRERPKEQSRQQECRPVDNSSNARLGMGSRAAQHFHRRNPSQHRVLASIIDDMNKDAGINKMVKSGGGRVKNVPVNIEAMEVEQENLERRTGRPEKKVTWSRDLLQVRSISPRQKSSKVVESSRTSRMSDAVNAFRAGSTQEGSGGVRDCGHFLCQSWWGLSPRREWGSRAPGWGEPKARIPELALLAPDADSGVEEHPHQQDQQQQ